MIFCHDFSQECIEAALEFLTFGKTQKFSDQAKTEEIYSLLKCLDVTGFTLDGIEAIKKEDHTPSLNEAVEERLSKIKGLKVDTVVLPEDDVKVKPEDEVEVLGDCFVKLKRIDAVKKKESGSGDAPEKSSNRLNRLANLSGITIRSGHKLIFMLAFCKNKSLICVESKSLISHQGKCFSILLLPATSLFSVSDPRGAFFI